MLEDIISGKPTTCGSDRYELKHLARTTVCRDGTTLSVQASHYHYCAPRDNYGPYTAVEVGYPTATPPESWAKYADGEYPASVYGYVPVELVREFVAAHNGEEVS